MRRASTVVVDVAAAAVVVDRAKLYDVVVVDTAVVAVDSKGEIVVGENTGVEGIVAISFD